MIHSKSHKKIKKMGRGTFIVMVFLGVFIGIYCISLLLPLFWTLLSSFKSARDYTLNPFGWPETFQFSNYSSVLGKLEVEYLTGKGVVRYGVVDMFANSLIMSICGPLLSLLGTACMAYVIARFSNKFTKFLYNFGIFLMVFAVAGTLGTTMLIYRALNIYDNYFMWLLITPQGCFSGMNFLILYGMFKRMPAAYAEAAEMDGAGHYRVFFRIMMPMAIPTLTVLFVLSFLSSWNDYTTPMTYLPSMPNLAYGMYLFQQQAPLYMATMPEILAGFVIVMIPTVIFYFLFQNSIVNKIQLGGLKG